MAARRINMMGQSKNGNEWNLKEESGWHHTANEYELLLCVFESIFVFRFSVPTQNAGTMNEYHPDHYECITNKLE